MVKKEVMFADGRTQTFESRRYSIEPMFALAELLCCPKAYKTHRSSDAILLFKAQVLRENIDGARKDALSDSQQGAELIQQMQRELIELEKQTPPSSALPKRDCSDVVACLINSVCQVLASLRCLQLPVQHGDVIEILSRDPGAKEIVQKTCEQLVAMRYSPSHILRKNQNHRLTNISRLFATNLAQNELDGLQTSHLVHAFLLELCESHGLLRNLVNFGMISKGSVDLIPKYKPMGHIVMSIPEYQHRFMLQKPPGETHLAFMLRMMYPLKKQAGRGMMYTFPMLADTPFHRDNPTLTPFMHTRLVVFTMQWCKNYDFSARSEVLVDPRTVSGGGFSVPLMLTSSITVGVDDSSSARDAVNIKSLSPKHSDYVIRALVIQLAKTCVVYTRSYNQWWRIADDEDPTKLQLLSETADADNDAVYSIDLESGRLADVDFEGRVTAVFYELYQSGCTDGRYNNGIFHNDVP